MLVRKELQCADTGEERYGFVVWRGGNIVLSVERDCSVWSGFGRLHEECWEW